MWIERKKFCINVCDVNANELIIPFVGLGGKNIRITVEEEVEECCAKWRRYLHPGGGIPTFRVNEPGCYSGLVGPAVYCPTCGKKL